MIERLTKNIIMPARSRASAPADKSELWIWRLQTVRVNAPATGRQAFFDRQTLVPGMRLFSSKANTVEILIGASNLGAGLYLDSLAPGDTLEFEPDEDTEDYRGTIGDAGEQKFISLHHPLELIDAAALYCVAPAAPVNQALFVTLYLRGGSGHQ